MDAPKFAVDRVCASHRRILRRVAQASVPSSFLRCWDINQIAQCRKRGLPTTHFVRQPAVHAQTALDTKRKTAHAPMRQKKLCFFPQPFRAEHLAVVRQKKQ